MPCLRRISLFVFLIFLSFESKADAFDENVGIGVVEVVPYNFFSLEFYNNPNSSVSDDGIYFYRDSVLPVLKYKFSSTGSDNFPNWFNPQVFIISKEKRKFQFFCIEKKGDWCKVITNKELGTTKWVELGFDVNFFEWKAFFPTVKNIEILRGDSLLFESTDANSKSSPSNLNSDKSYIRKISCIEIQGLWMHIEIIEKDEFGVEVNRRNGWIKWRDERQLLIGYSV